MLLIGMFDSPYVRRLAISMKRLELPFEHANWSVGADFERIRQHSPLGRQRGARSWLVDDRLTQADISVACLCTLMDDSLGALSGDHPYPALKALVDRCEALPEFKVTY
jgi:glutathione S-transferase